MKANNLVEALNIFNPKRPLLTQEELDNYFVERPRGSLIEMETYLLKKIKRKEFVNEDIVQELLHNLSLLEYRNDETWGDVHPIVKPLLSRGIEVV
jgi:hypothetical protein